MALFAKELIPSVIPAAWAAPTDVNSIRLYGRSRPYANASPSQFEYRVVRVDDQGHSICSSKPVAAEPARNFV